MKSSAHQGEVAHDKFLEFDLHGTANRADNDFFGPETERMIHEHGRIRVLVRMHDFHGWGARAFWEETDGNARHLDHIERLAIVGEKTYHQWMAGFARSFRSAQVRYFTDGQLKQAREWLNE